MVTEKDIKALQERWKRLTDFSLRRVLTSSELAGPFGRTDDGLRDFRGCPIDESLHKLAMKDIDYSFSILGSRGQFSSTVKSCIFVGAFLTGNLGTNFENCDFRNANLRESWMQGSFVQCVFADANLSRTRAVQAMFSECSFEKANLRGASFYECHFIKCSFLGSKFGSGSLADSVFADCMFDNPNLSKVVLDGTKGIEI